VQVRPLVLFIDAAPAVEAALYSDCPCGRDQSKRTDDARDFGGHSGICSTGSEGSSMACGPLVLSSNLLMVDRLPRNRGLPRRICHV
jgi:hypothetical protein